MLTYLIAHLSKKSKNGRDLKKTGESYRKVANIRNGLVTSWVS